MKLSKKKKILTIMLLLFIITVIGNGFSYKVNAGTVEQANAVLEDDTEVEVKMKILDGSGNQLELSEVYRSLNFEQAKALRFVISIDMPHEDAVVGGIDSDGRNKVQSD